MGLDMYLYKEKYFSTYSEDEKIPEIKGFDKKKSLSVSQEIIYWRKSNHIHKWFVDNCQNGADDCRRYLVTPKKLKELLETCETVKKEPDKALELLPPQSGFFFGNTNTDNWYWDDLNYTIKKLKKIFKDELEKEYDFYYQSSW